VREPVLDKKSMYRRMVAGEFGNTLPRFFTVRDWLESGVQYTLWGVQHTSIAGFPGTRLDVHYEDVEDVIRDGGFNGNYCIAPMVHQVGNVQWEGDVYDHPEHGVICSGNVSPANGSWRTHMKAPRLWEGCAATTLLRAVLNENSFDDLMELVAAFPNHVVELSALDACFGTLPNRNAVIWEVRRY
jgi:hypothetical protein